MSSNNTTDESATVQFAVGCVELVIGVLAVLPNITVLVLTANLIKLRPTHTIVFSMALADLMYSVTHCPLMFCQFTLQLFEGPLFCDTTYLSTYVFSTASSLSCLLLNLDKYVCLSRPLHYGYVATKFRVSIAVSIAWTIAVGASIFFLYGPLTIRHSGCNFVPRYLSFYIVFFSIFFLVPLVCSLLVSSYILTVRFRVPTVRRSSNAPRRSLAVIERKSTTAVASKSVLFVLSTTVWSAATQLPYRIIYILILSRAVKMGDDQLFTPLILFTLMVLNVLGNPCITIFTQRSYQNGLYNILRKRELPSSSNRSTNQSTAIANARFARSRCNSSLTRHSASFRDTSTIELSPMNGHYSRETESLMRRDTETSLSPGQWTVRTAIVTKSSK